MCLEAAQGQDNKSHGCRPNVFPTGHLLEGEPLLFEHSYFADIYRNAYDGRNPPYKHRSYVRETRRVMPEGKLLDVGCAYGAFLRQAVNRYECSGCDISAHAVQIASTRVPSARVFQASADTIPSTEQYDVVTAFDVLEHIPLVDGTLGHLRQLLRPGGALVVTMPVYDTLVGRLVEWLDHDPTHVHKLARYEWLERIAAAGFVQLSWRGILRYYFGGGAYLHFCHPSIRRFSPAILVTAIAP